MNMIESTQNIEKRIVFRETFNSEADVRRNGGTISGTIVFNKGTATPISTAKIYNRVSLNGVYSVRIKYKNIAAIDGSYYFDLRYILNSGTGYMWHSGGALSTSSGTKYVNGVVTGIINATSSDIIISGITLKGTSFCLGGTAAVSIVADMDLFEIYSGTLTAEEVKNLYENKRFAPITDHAEQLGAELIDQSAWYTAAYWNTFGGGWSQSGSSLAHTEVSGNLVKSAFWTIGKKYKITFTCSRIAGNAEMWYDGSNAVGGYYGYTPNGTYTYYYTPGTVNLYFVPYGTFWSGSITSLSIKEVTVSYTKEILNVSAQDGTIRNKYSGDLYGSELITNGNFNSGIGWSFPEGSWSISNGTANYDGNINSSGLLQALNISLGKKYILTFTISNIVGNFDLAIANTAGAIINGGAWTNYTSNGTYMINIIPLADTTGFKIYSGHAKSGTFSIDNISLKQVVPEVVNTSVTVVKDNDVWSMNFNGATSELNCGSYDTLVGDKTFNFWINARKPISPYYNTLLSNGQLLLEWQDTLLNLFVMRDIGTINWSYTASAQLPGFYNKPTLITITSNSLGYNQVYINAIPKAMIHTPTGVPVAGSDIKIGHFGGWYKGLISSVRIYDGLLTPDEISQLYSNEKIKYGL